MRHGPRCGFQASLRLALGARFTSPPGDNLTR
jgi:hypothetical protein